MKKKSDIHSSFYILHSSFNYAMLSFECDYNNGCHPEILKRLAETNDLQTDTYGFDVYSNSAKQRIREACECPDAQVFFLGGGTQTNATVIDSMLQSYQGG